MSFQEEAERLIDTAIAEDIQTGDITTLALVPKNAVTSGWFVMKQAGVVAGLPFLKILFQKIDPEIKITKYVEEGSYHKAGTLIAKVSGPAQGILTGERIALNLLQHACGIATMTAAYVKKLKGLMCKILDTRKTLPGLRVLEKYAVRIGGGTNHRYSLDDRYVIKSNHLYFQGGGRPSVSIREAVSQAKKSNPDLKIEIEVSHIKQLIVTLETEADTIMLSRMPPNEIRRCVNRIKPTGKKAYLESLGTITLDTIRAYAETGLDGIAIGSVTHSVPALDIVMRLK